MSIVSFIFPKNFVPFTREVMKIVELLSVPSTSPSTAAAEFLKTFQANINESLAQFVELLFHAGGWTEYEFSQQDFPPTRSFLIIKQQGPVSLSPPILELSTNFHTAFLQFLDGILTSGDSCLIYSEKYMASIIQAVCLMFKGDADAFNYVALLTGSKILYVLTMEFEKIKKKHAAGSESIEKSVLEGITGLYKTCRLATTLIASKLQKFANYFKRSSSGSLDVCIVLNIIWPSVNLKFILKKVDVVSELSNCLRDESCEARDMGYMILKLILSQPSVDDSRKIKGFQCFKNNVIYTLKHDVKRCEWALHIIGFAINGGSVSLNEEEVCSILFYVYDRNQSVAKLAARIIHQNFISSRSKDPYLFLVELVRLNKLSFLSSEDLLVDAFYEQLDQKVRWSDWERLITGSKDVSIVDSLLLFQAFVRKMTTGAVPQLRTDKLVKSMSEEKLTQNRLSFSSDFPQFFFKCFKMESIKNEPKALAALLKLIQYLNPATTSNINSLVDIAQVCLVNLQLNPPESTSSSSAVAEEASRSLAHLTKLSFESGQGLPRMLAIARAADSLGSNSFFGWNEAIFLALVKYLKSHNEFIWSVAFSQLSRPDLIDDSSASGEKYVRCLITLLFSLLFRDTCALSKATLNASTEAFVDSCKLRLEAFTIILMQLLHISTSYNVKKTCFIALLDSVEIFGRQLTFHGRIAWRHGSLNPHEYDLVFRFVADSLQNRSNCRIRWSRHAQLSRCCLALTKICDFICKGIVDVSCFALIIRKLIPNAVHEAIFIKTLDNYCLYFPLNWELVANALFKGVISLIDEVISCEANRSEISLAELWITLSHLSKNVLAPTQRSDPRVVRAAAVKVHQHVIDTSLRSAAPSSIRLIFLLEPLIDLLSADCIPLVIGYLDQYGSAGSSKEVQEYKRLLSLTFAEIQSA